MSKDIHNNYPGIPVVLYSAFNILKFLLSFACKLTNDKNEGAPE